ncbi:MAG: hypothetical protein ACLQBX_18050 [Candidatus Limnocylindrales bacterium]|jgi:hypothetical protein
MPDGKKRAISRVDEGGGAKRILVAAGRLDPAGGVAWIHGDAGDAVHMIPAIPADHLVRTVVAPGHPTEAGRQPKSPPSGRGCRANEWLLRSC